MVTSNQRLEARIGYQFSRPELCERALTHRSFGPENNERLEFLGDAVLDLVITQMLYLRFEDADEGQLSLLRASLVKGPSLATVARQLQLGAFISLGSGERKTGGADRDSNLANVLEALIGAIYLDAGLDICRARIESWFAAKLTTLSPQAIEKDPKSRLQEYLQKTGRPLPEYRLLEKRGQAHARMFAITCSLPDTGRQTTAEDSSRKKAERAAALAMLEVLGEQL
ncbi:MAG TPA: ribonuclease III [Porticoccaceae bacterium]|nr:ribonuclease III [Porticoccaceae bacterium]